MNIGNELDKPFLPKNQKKLYTLILDLDETLIHSNIQKNIYKIRPHAEDFIKELSNYYEIVIFTSGTENYANMILDNLDRENCISYRLYRQHTSIDENSHYKDLDKLGRDLSKTIIVDNSPNNFKYNKENGLFIRTWKDDPQDVQLIGLERILKKIVERNVKDVRNVIKYINCELDKNTIKSLNNPYDELDLNSINM